MQSVIGDLAGQVWTYLSENGDTTVASLARKLKVKKEQLTYSIGWLAREGKISLTESGSNVTVSLLN